MQADRGSARAVGSIFGGWGDVFRVWIETGLRLERDPHVRRKHLVVNIAFLLFVLVVGFYNLIFALTGNFALIRTGLIQLPMALFALAWLVFCQERYPAWGLFVLCVVLAGDVLLGIYAGQGTLINTHFYLLLFAMSTTLVTPLQRWGWSASVSLACVAAFLFLHYRTVAPDPRILELSPNSIKLIGLGVFVSMASVICLAMYLNDIFSRMLEQRLDALASSDALTELPNRRAFQSALSSNLARVQRGGPDLCLGLVDVDFFKRVNDTYGHDVGDDVLRFVARQLEAHVRASDVVARFGGEEFAIIMPGASIDEARSVAERILQEVRSTPFVKGNLEVPLSVSIGLSRWQRGLNDRSFLDQADKALYRAKQGGRDRVEAWDMVSV